MTPQTVRGACHRAARDGGICQNSAGKYPFRTLEASEAEVIAAAKAAQADEFIARLPQAYAANWVSAVSPCQVGNASACDSARHLRDAPVLLLDEATSALDAEAGTWCKKHLAI